MHPRSTAWAFARSSPRTTPEATGSFLVLRAIHFKLARYRRNLRCAVWDRGHFGPISALGGLLNDDLEFHPLRAPLLDDRVSLYEGAVAFEALMLASHAYAS